MSTCNLIVFTCNLFMSTCNKIMLTSLIIVFTCVLNYAACKHSYVACCHNLSCLLGTVVRHRGPQYLNLGIIRAGWRRDPQNGVPCHNRCGTIKTLSCTTSTKITRNILNITSAHRTVSIWMKSSGEDC